MDNSSAEEVPHRAAPAVAAASARGLARRLARRLCARHVHHLVQGHCCLALPPAFPPAPPASLQRPSRPPDTAWPCRQCARSGRTRSKTRGGSARLRPPIDCCVRDRAGSQLLVPAPAVHALLAIVRVLAMRALRTHALQDARRLCASPPAD